MEGISNKAVARNVFWNAFGSIFYLGAQWIVTVLVARISGFRDAGILSVAMSVSATFQTVANFGIRSFQVSDIDSKYSNSTYIGLRNITCLLSLLLCLVFSIVLGYDTEQILAIAFFMLFRLAESYSDVLHGIAQKAGRLDIAGKSFTVKGIILLVAFFVPYCTVKSLCVGLFFMALSSLIWTIAFDLLVIKGLSDFRLYEKASLCIKLAKETLPLFIYLFLFSTLTTIPKLTLEKMYDEVSLGAYSSIFSIASLFQIATGYIYVPFIHVFAEHYKNKDLKRFFIALLKVILATAVFALVTLLLASLAGEWALVIAFGEGIRSYSYLLIPILVSMFLIALLGVLFTIEIVIRDFKGLIIGNVAGFVACLALTPITIKHFQINGTSYGLIISASITAVIVSIGILIKTKVGEKRLYE